MKTLKKALAVLMVCLLAFSVMQIAVSALDEPVQEVIAQADVEAASVGSVIGSILGGIVFSPFILIDLIVWVLTGFNVHIFYDW